MKNLLLILGVLLFCNSFLLAQTCLENANIIKPVLSETARKTYETKLAEAEAELK